MTKLSLLALPTTLLILSILSGQVLGANFSGPVVSILDGDTLMR